VAGFTALSGGIVNIPDASDLRGAPFRVNRTFDAKTGYQTQSILAVPLKMPDGDPVGVLELFNHIDEDGRVTAFPEDRREIVLSLGAMVAVTLHNRLLTDQLNKAYLQTIFRLAMAAEYRDDDTGEHVQRVSRTSALIAEAMGLPQNEVELIQYASPMHDIGKIGIPDAVLRKPGRFTAEERRIMEQHANIGAEILHDPENDLLRMARDIATSHHEKWDGSGYPNGLSGPDIPLVGRIVALADVFDALVSKRCYKDAMALEKACEIVHAESGRHFDPDVVAAFDAAGEDIRRIYEPTIAAADSD
jgi:response regulator RpfG family c-di-GMP phosphodiesterase